MGGYVACPREIIRVVHAVPFIGIAKSSDALSPIYPFAGFALCVHFRFVRMHIPPFRPNLTQLRPLRWTGGILANERRCP